MTLNNQSTVIFVHSTAHWESIQQQKAQLLGVKPLPETVPKQVDDKKPKANEPRKKDPRKSHLIGKEGSRRRKRWTNSNFSEHPTAVLYAEDLRPPGYESCNSYNHRKVAAEILITQEEDDIAINDDDTVEDKQDILPQILTRHIRHDLKKLHISQGLVTNYELQLVQFIDLWLDDPKCLDHVYTKVISKNQFERYVLHTMSRYYGFHSFSVTNDHDDRETYIFHPAYTGYITKNDALSIDFKEAANWVMPERSFFEYLFQPRC